MLVTLNMLTILILTVTQGSRCLITTPISEMQKLKAGEKHAWLLQWLLQVWPNAAKPESVAQETFFLNH